LKQNDFSRLWIPFTYFQDLMDYPPLVIERGAGIYVFDKNGRKYIDAVGSWWVSIFGHNHPHITAAVKAQVDKIEQIMMAGFVSKPAVRLSHLLGALLPKEHTRIFYSDDGSTAVEVALKISLQYHALRNSTQCEFVGLGSAYHGDTLGAMSVSAMPRYHTLFHDRFKKHHSVNSPYCYRCPVGCVVSECKAECMDSLAKLFEERQDRIAACIFEPMVQGAAGMRVYPAKVLKRIFLLCRQYGILTIADEVATGFGRTGKLFACEHAGPNAIPDIMCLAKGLTGGYLPMGATTVKNHIFAEFCGPVGSERILYHGHSFTGNPLASSAACASMELIVKHDIPNSLDNKINYFHSCLDQFSDYDFVGDVRKIGLIGAIEFVKNKKTKKPFPAGKRFAFMLARKALDHGLILRPLGDVLYFIPTCLITAQETDDMFTKLHTAIKETIHANPAS
jgi:adenosylmethionine---8-amino-7-oxononanoate aminotransferase